MATVKLLLDRSRALKDGSFPLVFRIIHQRRKRVIYTPYKFTTEEYNHIQERVIYFSEEYRPRKVVNLMNRKIKKQRQSIDYHIAELELLGNSYDIDQIISRYRIDNDDLSLLGYVDRLIVDKQNVEKIGTAIAYSSTRSSLSRFIGSKHISILDIDVTFVKSYEHHLMLRGVKPNTICYYMRNFKSIYSQALCDGVETPKSSPFRGTSTKPQKTIKRALDSATIRRIKSVDLVDRKKHYALSRDLFIFSFLTRGMPFVDMFHLKKKCVNGNAIIYCRRKTGQWLQVALTDEIKEIIKRYQSDGEYIFPMLNDNDGNLRKAYKISLEKTNRQLKGIGKMLELNMPLTTYVARHCWATQAKELGFPTSVISEGLGHSSEKITQIYLKEFDRSVLDDVNEQITKMLF